MSAEFEPDPFTEALRDDLPSHGDEARVRARLATAGVLAGVGAVAPGATAAATTGTVTAGALAKVLALPLAAKLGATALLVGAVAVPVVRAHSHGTAMFAVAGKAAPARAYATPRAEAAPRAKAAETGAALPSPEAQVEQPTVTGVAAANADATAPLLTMAPGANRPARAKFREATPAAASNGASALPAVGSFPVAASTVDEGTLRAETALMEQALGALKRGDLATAKQKLAEHARVFPDGHLAPERDRALERLREKETVR